MSMGRSAKRTAITVLVALMVTGVVYWVAGTLANVEYTAIYDGTPTTFYFSPGQSPTWTFNLQVSNQAPFTLPDLNPFYSVAVSITGSNNTFAYFTGLGNVPRNFTNYSLNLGQINSGNSASVSILLNIGASANFSMRVDVWVSSVFQFKAATATYFFEYKGNNEYSVTRI